MNELRTSTVALALASQMLSLPKSKRKIEDAGDFSKGKFTLLRQTDKLFQIVNEQKHDTVIGSVRGEQNAVLCAVAMNAANVLRSDGLNAYKTIDSSDKMVSLLKQCLETFSPHARETEDLYDDISKLLGDIKL